MLSQDQITIDTPEQIALEFPLAGIGSRSLAFALDTLLQFVLYLVGTFALIASFKYASWLERGLDGIPPSWGPALVLLFIFCVYWGYFALFEIFWQGQTPGKRMLRIRVIHNTGRPINVYEAVGRNLVRAVDGFPGVYMVGLITMMISQRNQRLGDYLVGSIVVHEKRLVESRPDWATSATEVETLQKLSSITPEELVLIETYLQRRDTFDLAVRDHTARQIANRITTKSGIERQPDQSLDDFLESIARGVRDGARLR